ncbi:DUF2946 family protein [Orrella sp. JC864]|uniref:DUF2946 family protein n=1 Tax=Orrella sp. JC864 TaxID=3120298 RepID=UPI00300A5580
MSQRLSGRRPACWLALIAFVYATLLPVLGMASEPSSTARKVWLELCNAGTHERIAVDLSADADGPQQGQAVSAAALGHCLLCCFPSFLPETGWPAIAPATRAHLLAPVPEAVAPPGRPAWHPCRARAPPVPA